MKLYDIQELVSYKFVGINQVVRSFYDRLEEDRMIRLVANINEKILNEEQDRVMKNNMNLLKLIDGVSKSDSSTKHLSPVKTRS